MNNPETQKAAALSGFLDGPAIPVQLSRNTVVASIQVDLDDHVLARFQQDLLQRIHDSNSTGVILDLSALDTLDLEEFLALRRIISMSRIMGAESVLVGLKPGVVSSLIEVGADVEGLHAAIDLDAAYLHLESRIQSGAELTQDHDSDSEPELTGEQFTESGSSTRGFGVGY